MLLPPTLLFALSLFFISIYWLLDSKFRPLYLVICSSIIVCLASPISFVYALIASIFCIYYAKFSRWYEIRILQFLVPLGCFIIFLAFRGGVSTSLVDIVGIAFVTIKFIAILLNIRKLYNLYRSIDFFVHFLFFPTFAIGPIITINNLNSHTFASSLKWVDFRKAIWRISIGSFKYLILSGVLLDTLIAGWVQSDKIIQDSVSQSEVVLYVLLTFLRLYIIFSGLTDLAIGISALLGQKCPENFNYPLLARSLPDFWRRWHMSLMTFTSSNIFLPLVRKTGNREISVIIVFALIGLWHSLSSNYIIWGLMHGVLMGGSMYITRRIWFVNFHSQLISANRLFMFSFNALSIVFTLFSVALLSAFATSSSLSDGMQLIKLFFGLK